ELLSTEAGSAIIRQGAVSEGIYFLFEGTVEVKRKRSDGETARLAVVEAPSLIGELSLVVGGTSTATVSALTDCRLPLLRKAEVHPPPPHGPLTASTLSASMTPCSSLPSGNRLPPTWRTWPVCARSSSPSGHSERHPQGRGLIVKHSTWQQGALWT